MNSLPNNDATLLGCALYSLSVSNSLCSFLRLQQIFMFCTGASMLSSAISMCFAVLIPSEDHLHLVFLLGCASPTTAGLQTLIAVAQIHQPKLGSINERRTVLNNEGHFLISGVESICKSVLVCYCNRKCKRKYSTGIDIFPSFSLGQALTPLMGLICTRVRDWEGDREWAAIVHTGATKIQSLLLLFCLLLALFIPRNSAIPPHRPCTS